MKERRKAIEAKLANRLSFKETEKLNDIINQKKVAL